MFRLVLYVVYGLVVDIMYWAWQESKPPCGTAVREPGGAIQPGLQQEE